MGVGGIDDAAVGLEGVEHEAEVDVVEGVVGRVDPVVLGVVDLEAAVGGDEVGLDGGEVGAYYLGGGILLGFWREGKGISQGCEGGGNGGGGGGGRYRSLWPRFRSLCRDLGPLGDLLWVPGRVCLSGA